MNPVPDQLTVGSLFSGVGGFDLGLERAGMRVAWQVEFGRMQCRALERHWPGIPRWDDVRTFVKIVNRESWGVDLLCGGDPCPKHGNARRGQPSVHPDLSGYFLAVVGRLCPRWVVRENVPAPTVGHFAAGLEALGYGTVVVRLEASDFVPAARKRDFIVGLFGQPWHRVARLFQNGTNGSRTVQTRIALEPICATLTTCRSRHNTDENYVFEDGRIRILDSEERAAVTGFPPGWLRGFSDTACAVGYGNAVAPPVVEWLGRRIVESGL